MMTDDIVRAVDIGAAEALMREVCHALGWQGGTRHDALRAIAAAKRVADAADAYDREMDSGGAAPGAMRCELAEWRLVR